MQRFKPGTRVIINFGGFWHEGIVTDSFSDGHQTVISNSFRAGGVVEESMPAFSRNKMAEVRAAKDQGNLPPALAIYRARSKIGTKYDFFSWNCEIFSRWAHGFEPISPQLRRGAAVLGIGLLLFAAVRSAN